MDCRRRSARSRRRLRPREAAAGEHDAATVPDPYYGGPDGFNTVLDYVEDACQGLIDVVRKRATMYAAA